MKIPALIFFTLLSVCGLIAQTIQLKSGQSIPAGDLVRKDDMLMSSTTTSSGSKGQVGFRVADVAQINFPVPPAIATAGELVANGRFSQALTQIDPVVTYQKTIRDIPGNWWAKAAMVEVEALVGLKRQADAMSLANEISANTKDPEILTSAKLQTALAATYGDPRQALTAYDGIIRESTDPQTLSQAWIAEGEIHFAQHEFADALLAYLTVLVFYPDHNPYLPKALWGSGQAYAKLKDGTNALKAYQTLISTYPNSPEADLAKAELLKKENKT